MKETVTKLSKDVADTKSQLEKDIKKVLDKIPAKKKEEAKK